MSERAPTVLVSAAGGMPSKGLIDQLHAAGATIIGVDADSYSYGLRYADEGYVVPQGDDPKFVEELLDIVRTEEVDALLLSPESEAIAVSMERERFESEGCVPLCPAHDIVQRCTDKLRTHKSIIEMGIPTPTIYDTIDEASFPCIVKPQHGRGSTGIHIARNCEELSVYAANVQEPLIQEYVAGTEYTVDLLTDRDGTVLSVVPRERIGIESGKSITGKTVADEELREFSRQVASQWELFGPSCIQYIRGEDGPQFIEVNTRFGGGAVLSMYADQQLVSNLFSMINGSATNPSETYETDLVMLRNYEQLFVEESRLHE
jgi:carbamoyl-phosphate synthase large subunit